MVVQANPWIGKNYFADNVAMEAPPAYFLQRIHDFDSYLVIVPSRKTPGAYVIARRRQLSKGLTDKAIEGAIDQPDTTMCLKYGLVPVCLMYHVGTGWNPDPIIAKLKARDIWAHGGADKVADLLEAQEEQERQKTRAEIRDDLWNRSGDAWRSYQARTGQRTKLGPIVPKKGSDPTRTEQRTEIAPSSSTAGSESGVVALDATAI